MSSGVNLKEEWKRLGYAADMASATVVRPPDPDFVRAYYLTSADYGISAIGLRRLKVARFSEVNDPFEAFGVNLHNAETRKLVRKFKDEYDSSTGLLCFTSNWSNSMIWSHYANKHKGLCLGFDVRRSKVLQVEYVEERIRRNLNHTASISKALQVQLLRTKASYWQYEQELRRLIELSGVHREQGLYFCLFDADMELVEVILGPLSELPLWSVAELVGFTNPQAVVFKSRLAFRSFRVVPDGRSLIGLHHDAVDETE